MDPPFGATLPSRSSPFRLRLAFAARPAPSPPRSRNRSRMTETVPTPPQAGSGGAIDRRLLMVSSVVVLGAVMSILDTTVVNVAINRLAQEFDTTLPTIQWIVT